jgi:hypothetical protein
MGVVLDDLYDHEGYGARRLADGTLTGTWSSASATFDCYVACCGCGWHGGDHPPTEDGYESAVEEWAVDHARPLLARAVPDEITSMMHTLEQAIAALMHERPLAGLSALRSLSTWAITTVARAQTSLAPTADLTPEVLGQGAPDRARAHPANPQWRAMIERSIRPRRLRPPGLGL